MTACCSHCQRIVKINMGKQAFFEFLKDCGCCDICCLRFFKARGEEYEDVNESLRKVGVSTDTGKIEEILVKKPRANTCVTCLDFFSDELQEELLTKISSSEEIKNYDCDQIVIAISLPILFHLRQISIWLALVDKFGYVSKDKPPDVPIKEAAKLILSKKICQRLNKTYDQNGTMLNIYVNHVDEAAELEKFLKADQTIFEKTRNPKGKQRKEITRNYLERTYLPSNVSSEVFGNHFSVPPSVSNTAVYLEKITVTGPTVFAAGRYQKLSRELSHSPWVLQGKRVMEDSIQELIVRCAAPYFGVQEDKIIFSSSGREDVDVRCLGKGRPFVLEIPDSRKTLLSMEEAAKIEIAVEKHPKISIQNLQIVKREELNFIKAGEEKKRKFYRALCVLKMPATAEILEKLNIPNGFEIEQLTPLRVLHRRPLHKRPRTVYSVKAFVDRGNPKALILDIVTQAGTYIKELIHGEFGRTIPSISSIIGEWIDIIALDVTGIDLDWPKEVDNRSSLLDSNCADTCR